MKKQNWNAVQEAAEFKRPAPGGYIARIINVEDNEEKEYLKLEYDFAEGKFKGYYAELYKAKAFWGGSFIRSYKEKALPFFKSFKTCLEVSNRGYFFEEDRLDDMCGKLIGIVLGEEEYRKNDGSIGNRLYVAQTRSVKSIQDGDFKVPDLKKLVPTASMIPTAAATPSYGNYGGGSGFTDLNDDGPLPF